MDIRLMRKGDTTEFEFYDDRMKLHKDKKGYFFIGFSTDNKMWNISRDVAVNFLEAGINIKD